MLDILGRYHAQPLAFSPGIRRKQATAVCSRGDHSLSPNGRRNGFGQRVGPAQMAGQHWNGIAPVFIYHHHGRVAGFAFDIRRNGAHSNARRAHKHKGIRGKVPLCPFGQRVAAAAAHGAAAQGLCQRFGQRKAPGRKCDQVHLHGFNSPCPCGSL